MGRRNTGALPFVTALVVGCSGGGSDHPWLDLEGAPPHEVVEVSGASQGQLVIVVPPGSSYEEIMELGGRIAGQVPPGATVNARIFDDEATARNWRTAPADWTVQHLLAVVTGSPETGRAEVRWVGPEVRAAPPDPGIAVPPDNAVPSDMAVPADSL